MEANITKPEMVVTQKVSEIRIYFEDPLNMNAAIMDGGQITRAGFNIQPLWDELSPTQRGLIRTWYRRLSVLALNQLNTNNNVPGTVIEDDVIGDFIPD